MVIYCNLLIFSGFPAHPSVLREKNTAKHSVVAVSENASAGLHTAAAGTPGSGNKPGTKKEYSSRQR